MRGRTSDLCRRHIIAFHDQIRQLVAEHVERERSKPGGGAGPASDGDVLAELDRRGLLGDLVADAVRSVQLVSTAAPASDAGVGTRQLASRLGSAPVPAGGGPLRLRLTVLSGAAFLEHLGHADDAELPTLCLDVAFLGQRIRSHAVPSACEPVFNATFSFDLPSGDLRECARTAGAPVHVLLVRVDPDQSHAIAGAYALEWRKLLATGSASATLELTGLGEAERVAAGLLHVTLELLACGPGARVPTLLVPDEVDAVLRHERAAEAEADKLFFIYAKQWWRDFLQIRAAHKHRLVKIFALSEAGVKRPVTTFVQPLRVGRAVHSPHEALRLVSLLAAPADSALGAEPSELWHETHSVLARRAGDAHDKAALLCSLLLGFGLDAYVCVGTNAAGPALWCVTVGSQETGSDVVFWDLCSGSRVAHSPLAASLADEALDAGHGFLTLGCVFSDRAFYANIQLSDRVSRCAFDLGNYVHWKPMEPSVLAPLARTAQVCPLAPVPRPLADEAADGLEASLRRMLAAHRAEQALATSWDSELEYLLSPALAAYEAERVSGVVVPPTDFQQAVRRAVPEGFTFKGFPIQFNHTHAERIWRALCDSPSLLEIVQTRGDRVRFAVRALVVPFAEGLCSAWVMVAVRFLAMRRNK